jgi:hypothetical protein
MVASIQIIGQDEYDHLPRFGWEKYGAIGMLLNGSCVVSMAKMY